MFRFATIDESSGPYVAVQTDSGLARVESVAVQRPAPSGLRAILEDWDGWCDAVEAGLAVGDTIPWQSIDDVAFLPPLIDPPTVYCCGANFSDHVAEMGKEFDAELPVFFLIPPAALAGHRQAVRVPSDVDMPLDWEVELVVVIGQRTDNVPTTAALDVVAGYTIGNDVSFRGGSSAVRHSYFGHRWLERKGRRTFMPLGPSILPARYLTDPTGLDLSLELNGEIRQSSNTSQMILGVAGQIAYISSVVTLLPGDLIFTGTPAGTAAAHTRYLSVGDRMIARIEGLGALESYVAAA